MSGLTCQQIVFVTKLVLSVNRSTVCGFTRHLFHQGSPASGSFAFLANGQAYVKSEAVLRIARELPRWQWTWVFQFIPRVIRDAIYDLVARNRYRWFGRRDACMLPTLDRSWPR